MLTGLEMAVVLFFNLTKLAFIGPFDTILLPLLYGT